ncbi:zinc-ribbon domain-containing protein [Clostridium sp.]|jgi:predicted amidophosphoribosyltransferase|uniref:zinc-ribbon domain-containing protein n=1 Tax=Clostridium sp. TaxID=1506 RepID=UPI003EEBECB4
MNKLNKKEIDREVQVQEQQNNENCPNCGKGNRNNANFCRHCGKKIKENCTNCWVKKDQSYNCGSAKCPGLRLPMK